MKAYEIDELSECSYNEQHFVETHFKTINPFKGLSTLNLEPKQINILNRIKGEQYIIDSISERQIGTSTILAAHALWLALFHPNQRIVMMSDNLKNAKELRSLVKTGFKHLPAFLKVDKIVDHAGSLGLANHSWIHFTNSDPTNLRGCTPSHIILSNEDFFREAHRVGLVQYNARMYLSPIHLVAA